MRRVVIALITLVLASSGLSQDAVTPKVLIPLIVRNSKNDLLDGLKSASLAVSEHKTPVTNVELLHGSDIPLEVGLLIDTSRSEEEHGHFNQIVEAAKSFAGDIVRGPEDRMFFMTFASNTEATGWLKKEQLSGVRVNMKLGGATVLYESIAIACRERMGTRDWSHPTRRVLVIISDGDDNQSRVTRDQAASEALQSGAVIFSVDTRGSFGQREKGDRILAYFSEVTGGEFYGGFTSNDIPKAVPKAFERIRAAIEGMYYASYSPPISNSRIHEVEVKPASKERLQISYPRKYVWVR